MLKNGKRVRRYRRFSEDLKIKIVSFYEKGEYSVPELEKIYDISNALIYRWIYKYSALNKKGIQVVEMKDSQQNKIKELENRSEEHTSELQSRPHLVCRLLLEKKKKKKNKK